MTYRKRVTVLILGGIAALVCSLSAHAFMLEYLHVPSPHLPHLAWVRLPDNMMRTAALVAIYCMLSPRLKSSPIKAVFVLLLLFLTVNETLFRDPFMEVVNLSNLTLYPFLDVAPLYLTAAALALGIVAAGRWLRTPIGAMAVCVLLAGIVYLIVSPLLQNAFVPVRAWTQAREGHGLYNPPYDWHILVPAYLTYAEPVIGAIFVSVFTSLRLPSTWWKAWAVLTLVIFALRGVLFGGFINIFYSPNDPITALLSVGQFSIENLLLAAIVAAAWVVATDPQPGPRGRSFGERGDERALPTS